ncbi:hypothetical protein [Amycolatopsis sp. NPDC051071]|uniref:hypothetical protein n=1 Tax=Amycolatopsis sp. NPDC051071 TaxID=3154637 RepID=UPI00341F1395
MNGRIGVGAKDAKGAQGLSRVHNSNPTRRHTAPSSPGEVEQAATALGRAVDLAAGVTSVRPARRIETVARRLTRYRRIWQSPTC